MGLQEALRVLAGIMVLLSVVLTVYVDPRFVWFTVFIGLNLFQSGFSKWCPAFWMLRKLGLKEH